MDIHKIPLLLLLILITTSPVYARCRAFVPEDELPRVPIIIEGLVTYSNNDSGELSACAGKKDCIYRSTIQVLRVLKGELQVDSIQVQYPYWQGCPGVNTFKQGERRYFFLNEHGTLYGNSCGFSGTSLTGKTATLLKEYAE